MDEQHYAHVKRDDVTGELQYQTVAEHLLGTAALSKRFAAFSKISGLSSRS